MTTSTDTILKITVAYTDYETRTYSFTGYLATQQNYEATRTKIKAINATPPSAMTYTFVSDNYTAENGTPTNGYFAGITNVEVITEESTIIYGAGA